MAHHMMTIEAETKINVDIDLNEYVDDIREFVTSSPEETLEWFDSEDLLNQLVASGEKFEFKELEELLEDDTADMTIDDVVAKCGREPSFLNDLHERVNDLISRRNQDVIIEMDYVKERLAAALAREAVLRAKVSASLADLQSSETLTDIVRGKSEGVQTSVDELKAALA